MKSLSQNLWSKKNNLMVNLNHQNQTKPLNTNDHELAILMKDTLNI